MDLKLTGLLMAGCLAAALGAGPANAGAGQAAAAAAAGAPQSSRTTGYARSFDWHQPVPHSAPARPGTRVKPVVAGHSGWICAPAGAGLGGHCQAR